MPVHDAGSQNWELKGIGLLQDNELYQYQPDLIVKYFSYHAAIS